VREQQAFLKTVKRNRPDTDDEVVTATIFPRGRRVRRRGAMRSSVVAVALLGGVFGLGGHGTTEAVADDDWQSIVNTYRAMSNLDPVTANGTWSAEAAAHSCYMLENGISHDEVPGNPGYTSGGDTAGNSSNVAVSSSAAATARDHIELWMTGPFHAIGVLRHNLTSSGFGMCADDDTPTSWRSGATLDVIRGLDTSIPRPSTPILFPGDGATVPLNRFITEYPNPVDMCGWSGAAGLPLIAMMPNDVTSATATLTGPDGPIPTCSLHKGNTSSTARAILDSDNAVVVMPREVLADGVYTVTLGSNGGDVTWSFTVDQDAPLSAEPQDVPDTEPATEAARFEPIDPFRHVDSRDGTGTVRLAANRITRIPIAGPDVVAVSANFVAVGPDDYGFITAYNCTTERPTVSTIGYRPGQVVANQAIVPLQEGDMCLYSLVATDIVVDVNGYYRTGAGSGFEPMSPTRLHDSRATGSSTLRAGVERSLQVTGVSGGAPSSANAVALNVTAVAPSGHGYLQVYPCGSATAAEISTVNYTPNDYRPNSVVTPVDDAGRICVRSLVDTEVLVDFTGYFVEEAGLDFVPLDPVRWFDSRSRNPGLNESTGGTRVRGGQVVRLQIAGERGVPADAAAVSVNLTATNAAGGSYLTAYPCGTRPATSNLNIVPWQVVAANGAMVKLSSGGELCLFSLDDMHVIVDLNGAWS
jgi:hypothetical protein